MTSAVVSGASSGIGAAVAEEFLRRGYEVTGLSRRGNADLDAHEAYHDRRVDLRDADSVHTALAHLAGREGPGRCAVVLNSGLAPEPCPLTEVDWGTASDTYTTNVATALHLVQATAPLLRTRGGSLTFVGSSTAGGDAPERWSYAASKSALTTLMRSCSVEFADDGVVANELRPGPVATAMTVGAGGDRFLGLLNSGYRTDWLKPVAAVARWIVDLAEFPANGPTGQIFNYSRKAS
ncbi:MULTISPECIES: SDR family oxidoreductase [unclassified Streptomyces]|uniref:SDR family oxidoreductase n=1 Tax=unclassified Streptomyces TaxID=2593676 RepID=UPI00278C4F1A|nr:MULTISPECIES: SDR family oxidoreductase [unclassified Streptomyces]